jgi:tRNA (Thr-GGU) A37 N-methylase
MAMAHRVSIARPPVAPVGGERLLDWSRATEPGHLDAIDGTPVLDVKPHMVEMGPRTPVTEPDWAAELMREYWR